MVFTCAEVGHVGDALRFGLAIVSGVGLSAPRCQRRSIKTRSSADTRTLTSKASRIKDKPGFHPRHHEINERLELLRHQASALINQAHWHRVRLEVAKHKL